MKVNALAALLWVAASLPSLAVTGPSSSAPPYLVADAPGVEFTAILSAGDVSASGYLMAGVPDGLGAYDNGDGSITVLMNHELRAGAGAVRAHGTPGAFVSQWKIRKRDLAVLGGQDLIRSVELWDAGSQTYAQGAGAGFSRFCSADLAPASAFLNRKTGKGLREGRLFMNGEEDGKGRPRGFAHLVGGKDSGTSYELPLLGNHPFENLLANPFEQDKTLVAATEDGGANKLYFYVGEKQARGNPIERAGLANGRTYQLRIEAYTNDDPDTGFKAGTFSLVDEGGTSFARPEDGAWDTLDPRRFYFVTTVSFQGNSRLWEAVFRDIKQPERGGSIRVLLDGAKTGAKMLDNLTVDAQGNVYLQEDVGDNARLGRVWKYSPATQTLTALAHHDPRFFQKGGTDFLSENEESSGIIDVSELFSGVEGYDPVHNHYFLLDVQTHHPLPGELVEGGQLLLMKVPK